MDKQKEAPPATGDAAGVDARDAWQAAWLQQKVRAVYEEGMNAPASDALAALMRQLEARVRDAPKG